ncbi:MAG: DNA/RNA non-specific endonuclease [Firmicutes bacterium]|nr:DNA/RNA non-specific endonuclease [Bacillota bacterium]
MISEKSSEKYSKLDSLGRPGIAFANIGPDLMPEEERESIGMIKPAGFQTIRYDDLVEGKYLYNRCHLIGYQLTGENANEQNLITGTRYMNVDGMLPFENQIASYTETTGNHVLYRVSPVYSGKNLVCAGLQLEALSVEDGGEGICFNVFVYNVQPGIVIDYASGASRRASDDEAPSIKPSSGTNPVAATYIINISTKKFHYSTCSSVKDMSEKNKLPSEESRNVIVKQGFVACKRCNP